MLIKNVGAVPNFFTVGAFVFKNKSQIDKLIDQYKEIKGLEKVLSKISPNLQEKFNKNNRSLNVETTLVDTGDLYKKKKPPLCRLGTTSQMELTIRFELTTSSLPRMCSTN